MELTKNFEFEPIWSDSLGAKSTCCYVETPDIGICIDPGAAVMQPSYPLPGSLKNYYKSKAEERIHETTKKSDLIVISHYHFDHYAHNFGLFKNKKLWIKNPNKWINRSQWKRARDFLKFLAKKYSTDLKKIEPLKTKYTDPYETNELKIAREKDFGEYQDRREELLNKWRKRFKKLRNKWSTDKWIKEPDFVNYADGKTLEVGETKISFQGPFFHGIEYSKTGWVFSTVVEYGNKKFIHSSDLQGPTIEDQAEWVIQEDPDVLFLDGPATYLYGFLLNKTNLERSINNAARITKEIEPDLMIYDHHLLRESKYKERTQKIWSLQEKGYEVKTAAEHLNLNLNQEPLILRIQEWGKKELKKRKKEAKEELNQN